MYLYNTPTFTKKRPEKVLAVFDTLILYAIIICFLICTTDFALRADNTFSNAFAGLTVTREVADALNVVMANCSVVSRLNVNFSPVTVRLTEDSAPLSFGIVTGLIAGIIILAGFEIITNFTLKICMVNNIQYMRIKGLLIPFHTILILGDVGLSVAVIAAIGASQTTRSFLANYVDVCAAQLRQDSPQQYFSSDIDTDSVFGTLLLPLLVVYVINLAIYGVEGLIKVYLAWDKEEAAMVKARYPYLSKGPVGVPVEPLLLEYNLLREAKLAQMKGDPANSNPLFQPVLTGQYREGDGPHFTHAASLTLDDLEDVEVREAVVQSMLESCAMSGSTYLQVPRTFVVGADPDDPLALKEMRMHRSMDFQNRREQQRKGQEALEQQYREAKMKSKLYQNQQKSESLSNAAIQSNNENNNEGASSAEVAQPGQAWDPTEDDNNFYDPLAPNNGQLGAPTLFNPYLRPSSAGGGRQPPRNSNFAHTTAYAASGGSVPRSGASTPSLAVAGPDAQQQANFFSSLSNPVIGSGGVTTDANGPEVETDADAFDHNASKDKKPKKDKKDKQRSKEKKEKKDKRRKRHHSASNPASEYYDTDYGGANSSSFFEDGGGDNGQTTNDGTNNDEQQVYAYYDADGNLLGEGTTLEGLDGGSEGGADYVYAAYDEFGNLLNEDELLAAQSGDRGRRSGSLGKESGSRKHRKRSDSDKKDKGSKKHTKDKSEKDKSEHKKEKKHRSHNRDTTGTVVEQQDMHEHSTSPVAPNPSRPAGRSNPNLVATTSSTTSGGLRSIPAPTLDDVDDDDEAPIAPPPATSRLTTAQQEQM